MLLAELCTPLHCRRAILTFKLCFIAGKGAGAGAGEGAVAAAGAGAVAAAGAGAGAVGAQISNCVTQAMSFQPLYANYTNSYVAILLSAKCYCIF
jgi:hypothetical protein